MKFYGVRGSCPVSGEQYRRYGGNTSCVTIEIGDEPPIIVDLGTGLRPLGHELAARSGGVEPVRVTSLLTHLHWDHIIGLPFFMPLLRPEGYTTVYGPPQDEASLYEVMDRVVQPPFFPVRMQELHGAIEFRALLDDDVAVGSAKVKVRQVPHVGATLGFRIEAEGVVVAFVSDHQAPDDRQTVAPGVLELADGADVLIHDAQYTDEQFVQKATWGHSTINFAVHVAAEAGARHLVLYHHDPVHTDDDMNRIAADAARYAAATRLPAVTAAAEGSVLELGAP